MSVDLNVVMSDLTYNDEGDIVMSQSDMDIIQAEIQRLEGIEAAVSAHMPEAAPTGERVKNVFQQFIAEYDAANVSLRKESAVNVRLTSENEELKADNEQLRQAALRTAEEQAALRQTQSSEIEGLSQHVTQLTIERKNSQQETTKYLERVTALSNQISDLKERNRNQSETISILEAAAGDEAILDRLADLAASTGVSIRIEVGCPKGNDHE